MKAIGKRLLESAHVMLRDLEMRLVSYVCFCAPRMSRAEVFIKTACLIRI